MRSGCSFTQRYASSRSHRWWMVSSVMRRRDLLRRPEILVENAFEPSRSWAAPAVGMKISSVAARMIADDTAHQRRLGRRWLSPDSSFVFAAEIQQRRMRHIMPQATFCRFAAGPSSALILVPEQQKEATLFQRRLGRNALLASVLSFCSRPPLPITFTIARPHGGSGAKAGEEHRIVLVGGNHFVN